MPLCPQITNTPITVTQTADFTVSSVLPVVSATTTQVNSAISAAALAQAEADAAAAAAAAAAVEAAAANAAAAAAVTAAASAATAAGEAQADATEALADAAAAYTAATGSLQPSASTIVNASNQMTAIAANGITVYSGASASSGARVVLNSTGLAGFNSGGTATFSISASTGAAVFSGSVTGSTITGGTLNINGNAIISATGLLTATGATITGDIRATAGYFGTATNGFSISSTGLVGVGTGTIVGGAIQGVTFTNGTTFSVTSTGFLTASNAEITGNIKATSGYIGSASTGWQFTSSGYLYGSDTTLYPTTSPGGDANTYSIYTARGIYADKLFITNTQAAAIYSNGGLYALGALNTAAGGTGSPLFRVNTSGAITDVASIISQGAITASGTLSGANITTAGNLTVSSYIYNPGYQVSTSGGAARINDATTPTARLVAASGSSIRFKKDIVDISTVSALNPKLLLQVPVKAFKYREDYLDAEDERSDVLVPGFIAEELDAIYPVAVDHDAQDRASRWSSDFIVPGMLALIQDLYKEVQTLKGE
jgi:trimeric autotransporter adhesin